MPRLVFQTPAKSRHSVEVTVHEVTIRRAALGWMAECTCGWCAGGIDKRMIEAMAGSHDLDEAA